MKITLERDHYGVKRLSGAAKAVLRVPKNAQVIANVCQWIYKSSECGYNPSTGPGKDIDGTNFRRFDVNNEGVTTDAEDVCGKRIASCKCRFGDNNELPFGSFPGAGLTK